MTNATSTAGARVPAPGKLEFRDEYTPAEAARVIRRTDRYRSDYHKYYTGENWKDSIHYDLCLNSASLGRDTCVEVIKRCVVSKVGIPYGELRRP